MNIDGNEGPLSAALIARAWVAANGELAWHLNDAIAAVRELAAKSYALLGAEIWLIQADGNWTGLIPCLEGGPEAVWTSRSASWNRLSESWSEFVTRKSARTIEDLEACAVESWARSEVVSAVRYNLSFANQKEYEALRSA